MSPRLASCAGAFLALVSAVGCEQVLGLRERTETSDIANGAPDAGRPADAFGGAAVATGHCGPLLHASASCASCMDQSCCAQAHACAGDAACRETSDCLAGCSDVACEARCTSFGALPDTLIALRACRVGTCATACGSACGENASAVSTCQTCEQGSCCAEGATCAANTDCAALQRCVANCFGAASCPTDCQAKYPKGANDFASWFSCTNQCSSACTPGQSWACLGSPIVWPKPSAVGNITFSVTFVDFSSEEPFVGASVKACSKLDFICASPLGRATSDGTGLVSLTVPAGLSGFDGYLDISGGSVSGNGPTTFPTLWYPVPVVVVDGWRGRTQLLSADEFVGLAMATGTTVDPKRGHIAVNAADCAFGPASGVSFTVDVADAKTVSYYLVGGVPVTTATATDSSGIGAFVNIPTTSPATLAVVRATSGLAQGKSMGSLTFVLRAGTLTTPSLFPPVP